MTKNGVTNQINIDGYEIGAMVEIETIHAMYAAGPITNITAKGIEINIVTEGKWVNDPAPSALFYWNVITRMHPMTAATRRFIHDELYVDQLLDEYFMERDFETRAADFT